MKKEKKELENLKKDEVIEPITEAEPELKTEEAPEAAPEEANEEAPKEAPEGANEEKNFDFEADVELFHDLFPDVKAKDVPKEVWEEVEKGIPLSASYALFEKKEQKKKEEMETVNRKNAESAPPKLNGKSEDDYLSPEAVKAMSPEQVRKNYNKILKSMDKWN